MSDIFENDIEQDDDITALEDDSGAEVSSEKFVFDEPLYALKLDYSCEGIFASPGSFKLEQGENVIVPTRYGKDLARVLGKAKSPLGIKKDDIVQIERKATSADLQKVENFKKRKRTRSRFFKKKSRRTNSI